jgi:hypothetical protein
MRRHAVSTKGQLHAASALGVSRASIYRHLGDLEG